MNEQPDLEKTVGQYVAEDYRVAKVFERYGIDFCCGGMIPLRETCRDKAIDSVRLLEEIQAIKQLPIQRSLDYNSWELSFLADYIINTHHAYIKENVRKIASYAQKIAEVHGPNHPELIEVAKIFGNIVSDLLAHLREEEEVLFPAVKRLDAAKKAGIKPDEKDVELISDTLKRLAHEHEDVGEAVHTIRRLTKDFAIPEDACNTFRITYHQLQEFEDDLHKHVHLENNILFPKASQTVTREIAREH